MYRAKHCQYGAFPDYTCGQVAVTKRRRYTWAETLWDLCEEHAATVDRIRSSVSRHSDLLKRLADG